MVVALGDLTGFKKFTEEVFGAEVSMRNNGENVIVSMTSGIIIGTLNGKLYTFTGPQELIKTILGLWQQGLAHLEEIEKVQVLAPTSQHEGEHENEV